MEEVLEPKRARMRNKSVLVKETPSMKGLENIVKEWFGVKSPLKGNK